MQLVDIHEDIQTYWISPQLLGYPEKYEPKPFDEYSPDRHADIPGYKRTATRLVFTSIFPYKATGEKRLISVGSEFISQGIKWYEKLVQKHPTFQIVKNIQDLDRVEKSKKIGIILHL